MADQDYQPTGEVVHPRHAGGDAFWELLELAFPIMPLCVLLRKECFLRVGLFNRRINGIDDWDIFTRIAEIYPIAVVSTAVGIYRQPTPASGQGSSARAAQLRELAHHQRQLLKLPRVAAASPRVRGAVRRRTRKRISENLIWTAAKRHLPQGQLHPAYTNISVALRLDPLCFVRPEGYRKLARKLRGETAVQ